VIQPPVIQPPVIQPPVIQPPVVQPPVVQTPVVQTPVVQTPVVQTPVVQTPVAAGPTAAPPPISRLLRIWLTGYSWQDNTPPGSSIVSLPILHQKAAGGQGTFADPITVAVPGHLGSAAWPAGTRFYLPTVRRYVIVEDTGASPPPSGADTHLDMWIDGQDGSRSSTEACMSKLTGTGVPAQLNPPDGLPVIPGPIFANGRCNPTLIN
jgi:hypothetical protein